MPTIRFAGFAGENRALHPKLLPEAACTASRNQKPGRGDLRPWRQPLTVASVPTGRQTIYRMGSDIASDGQYWLSWPTVVHAVRGFETGDTTERTYYTGDGAPKVTDNIMAPASTPYPTASRPMGIPAPATPLLASVVDPTIEVVRAGQPARHETVTAPRVITDVEVRNTFFGLSGNSRLALIRLAPGHGIVTGDVVDIQITTHPALSGQGITVTLQDDGVRLAYRVASDTAVLVETAAVGTVTKESDVVFFPAVPPVMTDPESFGSRDTRFYTYTYVNDWGWESAPAPPGRQVDALQASTVTLSGFAAVPAGNYQVNRIRVYRTQTGASAGTDFFLLREVPIGTVSTQDDNRMLGEVLPTTTWLNPPDDLSYLTKMWNGMTAGISGGEVRISEAYVPYAWPIAFDVVPPEGEAVALGVFGQSMLVLTTGRPLLVQGSSPDSMDQMPLEIPQACIAPRSVAAMGTGVAWASNDGLCWYGANGARILTAGLMTREQWLELRPETLIGRMYEGLYLGSYDDGAGRKAFLIDPMNPTGLYFLDVGYEAMHFDELQDQLYILSTGNVQRWDAGAFMTVRAKSKEFRAPRPMNFGWAEVTADAYPVTVCFDCVNLPAADVTKITTAMPILSAPTPTTVRYTATVTGRKPFPLPSGWLSDDFQIEVETSGAVQGVAMSTSIEELRNT